MRLMYDAASVGNIPADAQMVGYYVDGKYKASGADLSRFPHAVKVGIAVFPTTNAGIVFDGPPDNATWPQVVSWVAMRRKAGVDPSVYTDADQWATALAAFRAAGVPAPHWWIARWDGKAELIDGSYAHQYTGDTSGGYDRSAVADYWPGVDPAPNPTPAPAPANPRGDDEVAFLLVVKPPVESVPTIPEADYYLMSGPLLAHFPNYPDASAMAAVLGNSIPISPAMLASIKAASAALRGTLSGSLAVSGNLAVS